MMTKSLLLKIGLAAAIATPAVGYGVMRSLETGPATSEAPTFDQAPRGDRRFLMGDVEPGFERPTARAEARAEGPRRERAARADRGERVRPEGEARRPRGERRARGEGRGERGARLVERMTADLQLTEEQAVRVRAVFEGARHDRGALRDLSREERRAAFRERRDRVDAELAEILTPAQRDAMEAQRAERRAGWQVRGGESGMRGRNAEAERYRDGVDTRGI